jgi:hypothetical protein
MYGDNTLGALVVVFILCIFAAFGYSAAKAEYQHDTFDCTNTCGGKHSIQYYVENNKVCFCEASE